MAITHKDTAAMCQAHHQGDIDAIRKLLETKPEIEKRWEDYGSWLHVAAQVGNILLVDFWLERGWDVNLNTSDDEDEGVFTPLHVANDATMTRHLLARGASVNAYHRQRCTPLHIAVVKAVEPSQKGRRRAGGANTDQIRALLEAGADLTLMAGEGKGQTPLALAIALRRQTAEQVLREAGAPETGRRPGSSRPKTTTLDLRQDFAAIYKYLSKRVRAFDPATHEGLGGPGKVKAIHCGFDHVHSGWVVFVFDTRPNAEPDGEWQDELEGELKLPHWHRASETNLEEPITLLLPDRSQSIVPANTELAVLLGDMLKAVLLRARAEGVFAQLAKKPGCELRVEHFEGAYGWPKYEDRGVDNLA